MGIDAVAVTVESTSQAAWAHLVGTAGQRHEGERAAHRAAFEARADEDVGKKWSSASPGGFTGEGSGFGLPIAVGILAAMGSAHRRRAVAERCSSAIVARRFAGFPMQGVLPGDPGALGRLRRVWCCR